MARRGPGAGVTTSSRQTLRRQLWLSSQSLSDRSHWKVNAADPPSYLSSRHSYCSCLNTYIYGGETLVCRGLDKSEIRSVGVDNLGDIVRISRIDRCEEQLVDR